VSVPEKYEAAVRQGELWAAAHYFSMSPEDWNSLTRDQQVILLAELKAAS
jgi:hypothetical protein